MWSSFAYHEPSPTQIIIILGYIVLLNVIGKIAQWVVSAGLLGQILVGIVFGTPLAGILEESWQETLVVVGYVGLLLVVFEGGMSASLSHTRSLLPLSSAVALTGLLTPIALSFILMPLNPSPALHAFAAGSALSSTSLGTVLAVLHPSTIGFDLRQTAFGTVLLSAAVMDDIVAFILVRVLTILGSTDTDGSQIGRSIGRTIGVTLALGLLIIALSIYLFRPGYARLQAWQRRGTAWGGKRLNILLLTLLFVGMVSAAGYAGTSPLYGAYIAGLAVAYVAEMDHSKDSEQAVEMPTLERRLPKVPNGRLSRRNTFPSSQRGLSRDRILSSMPATLSRSHDSDLDTGLIHTFEHYIAAILTYLLLPLFFGSIGYSIPFIPLWRGRVIWRGIIYTILMILGKAFCGIWILLKGRKSWRAAMVLGLAMISRGEIGLLIAQVARGTGEPLLDENEFLIVIWGIVLCTIVGPLGVGWTVKRWRKRILDGGWG